MSGESRPELTLAVGQEIEIYSPDKRDTRLWTEKVVKIARVWITTDKGRRFRLDTMSEGHDFGYGGYHFTTPEIAAYRASVSAAWAVLKEHGLAKAGYGDANKLHDVKLFAIARLLEQGVTHADAQQGE